MATEAPAVPSADAETAVSSADQEPSVAIVAPETPEPAVEPAKPVVPEKYELQLPKDSHLPVAAIEKTAAIARVLGLSNEAAQQVIDSFHATLSESVEAERKAWEPGKGSEWKRQQAEWTDAALKDAEIGGTPDKLKVSAEKANQVLRKFGSQGVTDYLNATGIGSHPEFLKMLAKIGRAMSESTLVIGSNSSPPVQKTHAERLYGGTPAAA